MSVDCVQFGKSAPRRPSRGTCWRIAIAVVAGSAALYVGGYLTLRATGAIYFSGGGGARGSGRLLSHTTNEIWESLYQPVIQAERRCRMLQVGS